MYRQQVEGERIISKTRYQDYSKYLDTFYYNLGSIQIPVSAFLSWLLLRKHKWLLPGWLIGIGWLLGIVSALAGSSVWL
jgi:hypothetical protein